VALDWKDATPEMKDYDIDTYLAEINIVVDDLRTPVHLVGLCQGGWMSAMYASRFPDKVRTLVLAGAPIDTDTGNGPIKRMAHGLPMSVYRNLVAAGGGRMCGEVMLAGWKNMHPGEQYPTKYIDVYETRSCPATRGLRDRLQPVDPQGRVSADPIQQRLTPAVEIFRFLRPGGARSVPGCSWQLATLRPPGMTSTKTGITFRHQSTPCA